MGYQLYPKTIAEVATNYARKLGVSVEFDCKQARAYSTPSKIVLPALNLENLHAERILYGLMAHEAGHIHYSNFDSFASVLNPLLQDLVNALEDCRIEYLMSHYHLGVFENLEYANQCVYHHQFKSAQEQESLCKIKLIIRYLLVKTHEVLLHYRYSDTMAKLLRNELSCLINESSIPTLDSMCLKVGKCATTDDIIDLSQEILKIFYHPNFFTPNFERFVLANNSISLFDLKNAQHLAHLYGQSFRAPILGPNQITITSCQSIIDKHGLKLSESELNDEFIPSFIAPLLPPVAQLSEDINLQELKEKSTAEQVQHSLELSAQAAGNLTEVLSLCKSSSEKKHLTPTSTTSTTPSFNLTALALTSPPSTSPTSLNSSSDQILSHVTLNTTLPVQPQYHSCPALGIDSTKAHHKIALYHAASNDTLNQVTDFTHKYVLTKDILYSSLNNEQVLDELTQLILDNQVSTKSQSINYEQERFATIDLTFNPLYGAYKNPQEFLEKATAYQKKLSSHLPLAHPVPQAFLDCTLTADNYDCFIKPTLSLELATRLFLESIANPMRCVPLWQTVNIYPFIYVFQDFNLLKQRQDKLATLLKARLEHELFIPESLADNRKLNKRLKTTIDQHRRFFKAPYFTKQLFKEAEQFQKEGVRFPAFQYDEASEELKLIALDKGYTFDPTREFLSHDKLIQMMMEDRISAKVQRHEAILKEMGLADSASLDPLKSIDPDLYCRDSKGKVYLKYYYERSVVAKKALLSSGLNNSQGTIAPVVASDHFSALLKYSRLTNHRFHKNKEIYERFLFKQQPTYPQGDFMQELFYDLKYQSPWTLGTNEPLWRINNIGVGAIDLKGNDPEWITKEQRAYQCPFNLKKQPIEVKRQNSLYLRYCRFLNNLTLLNLEDTLNFHQTLLAQYSHNRYNKRDPRAENTFADALREYYLERFIPIDCSSAAATQKHKQKKQLPSNTNHLERYQQELQQQRNMLYQNPTYQPPRTDEDFLYEHITGYDLNKFSIQDLKELALNAEIFRHNHHVDFKTIEQELKRRLTPEILNNLYSQIIPQVQEEFVSQALQESTKTRQALEPNLTAYYQMHYDHTHSKGKNLNINKAQLIPLGERKIFKNTSAQERSDTIVHLLIDISSSMANEHNLVHKLLVDKECAGYVACKSALSIALALEQCEQVSVEATFFPGPYNNKHYLNILSAGDKVKDKAKYFLQVPRLFTPTAEAINYAIASLNKQDNKRKIIILITDGMPDRVSATKKAIKMAAKFNIEIYSLGIGINQAIKEIVSDIFPNIITINDYHQLPKALSELINKQFDN